MRLGPLCAAFAAAVALGTLPAPALPAAQQGSTVWRVGVLALERPGYIDAIVDGLRQLDYVEGRNLVVDRQVAGREDDLPRLAGDLVRRNPHVIIAVTGRAALALQAATKKIPIVLASAGDPLAQGLVMSLTQPGGNITGFSNVSPELSGKRLQILKEVVPRATRIGVLRCDGATSRREWTEVQPAAEQLGLQLVPMVFRRPEEVVDLVERTKRGGVTAVLVFDCSILPDPERLTGVLNRSGLPAAYPYGRFVRSGGLISYGSNAEHQLRRAALFVDKIVKGAKPSDLPVEQPTTFELVVNLKTARALGVSVPASLLTRADQVIQ